MFFCVFFRSWFVCAWILGWFVDNTSSRYVSGISWGSGCKQECHWFFMRQLDLTNLQRREVNWELSQRSTLRSWCSAWCWSVFFFMRTVSNFQHSEGSWHFLVHAELFGHFHSPPNSDVDCWIFNMHMIVIFLRAYTHEGPRFTASFAGLLWSLHRIWLRRNPRA